jgi:hypothetical protein
MQAVNSEWEKEFLKLKNDHRMLLCVSSALLTSDYELLKLRQSAITGGGGLKATHNAWDYTSHARAVEDAAMAWGMHRAPEIHSKGDSPAENSFSDTSHATQTGGPTQIYQR